MENQLTVFSNKDFGNIRVVTRDGAVWFVAADVCKALDLSNPTMAVKQLADDERAKYYLGQPYGEVNVVNEPGLYRLIFTSRKDSAEKFQRWVYHEVLPSIRKRGIYATDSVIDQILGDPDFGIKLLIELKTERSKNAVLTQQIDELQPKASYYDTVLNCKDLVAVSVIAKDYGFSAKKLNDLLYKLGVQFKQGGIWLLYQKYSKLGWTSTKTQTYNGDDGKVHSRVHTYWTQKGRLGLYEILKRKGYKPLIEIE